MAKGTEREIKKIIELEPILKNRTYEKMDVKIADLYKHSEEESIWGDGDEAGYPFSKIILAIAYVIAAKTGQVNGLRPKGSKDRIIHDYLEKFSDGQVTIWLPELMTPLVVQMDRYAAMVGPDNPKIYKKLIQISDENEYKLTVRSITEEDLK